MKTLAEHRVLTERHRPRWLTTPEEYYSRPSIGQSVDAAAICFGAIAVMIVVIIVVSLFA